MTNLWAKICDTSTSRHAGPYCSGPSRPVYVSCWIHCPLPGFPLFYVRGMWFWEVGRWHGVFYQVQFPFLVNPLVGVSCVGKKR